MTAPQAAGAVLHGRAGEGDPLVCMLEPGEPDPGIALLTSGFDVITLHGGDKGVEDETWIEALIEAIAELGVAPTRLLGYGAESRTAALLAASLPDQVERLVLSSSPPVAPTDRALSDALGGLQVPTLALRGTEDREADGAVTYRALLPECQDLILYDAGAPLATARPEAFAAAVTDFLLFGEGFALDHAGSVINP